MTKISKYLIASNLYTPKNEKFDGYAQFRQPLIDYINKPQVEKGRYVRPKKSNIIKLKQKRTSKILSAKNKRIFEQKDPNASLESSLGVSHLTNAISSIKKNMKEEALMRSTSYDHQLVYKSDPNHSVSNELVRSQKKIK